ncbi:MAG: DUF484 family protein [Aeromonadaceae bacterium]
MSEPGLLRGMQQEEEVVEYLLRHPEFFLRHKALLDALLIPHPVRGALSLVELQQERQRERVLELEQELRALMSNASRNEHIFRVYADVYPELFACTTLRQLWKRLHLTFRERLRIPASALWINDGAVKAKRSDKGFALEGSRYQQICRHPMAGERVYFGRVQEAERATLFGADALVHSMALLRLGEQGELGFLAFGHANPDHYHRGMDSLLLEQLGRFITLLLPTLVQFHE